MRESVNLAGKRFGRWLVLDHCEISERGEKKWLCRCDCGTEKLVLARSLKSGSSTSCGCLRKEKIKEALTLDLEGKKFGELTVLKKVGTKNSAAGVYWLCRCDCGNEVEVLGTKLETGRVTHCKSPVHKKNYPTVDISGRRFSHLVALYPVEGARKKRSVVWHCRCDCGNEVDFSYNELVFFNIKSCGCEKRKHEQKLNSYLTYVAGTSVDIVKSKKVPKDNTTGHRGVYLIRGKYIAKIVFQKKAYYLGVFDKIEDAVRVRKEAEEQLFDRVAEHYEKWKALAEKDPDWAEINPIEVEVRQNKDKSLDVRIYPRLEETKQPQIPSGKSIAAVLEK
ncbi:MAG: hypothetical protein IKM38_03120 [Christensenellaceae bacterium]|nr:hypothetical protein [Christensenellaceae bacterium]